jgi:hypothetical protein
MSIGILELALLAVLGIAALAIAVGVGYLVVRVLTKDGES